MTIYDRERMLRDRLNQILVAIHKDGYNPTLGVHYNELMAELHEVQDAITSLEQLDDESDLEAPVATVGPTVPEGQ